MINLNATMVFTLLFPVFCSDLGCDRVPQQDFRTKSIKKTSAETQSTEIMLTKENADEKATWCQANGKTTCWSTYQDETTKEYSYTVDCCGGGELCLAVSDTDDAPSNSSSGDSSTRASDSQVSSGDNGYSGADYGYSGANYGESYSSFDGYMLTQFVSEDVNQCTDYGSCTCTLRRPEGGEGDATLPDPYCPGDVYEFVSDSKNDPDTFDDNLKEGSTITGPDACLLANKHANRKTVKYQVTRYEFDGEKCIKTVEDVYLDRFLYWDCRPANM